VSATDGASAWNTQGKFLKSVLTEVRADKTLRSNQDELAQSCIIMFTKDSLKRLEQSLERLAGRRLPVIVMDDSVDRMTKKWIRSTFDERDVLYHGRDEQDAFVSKIKSVPFGSYASRLGIRKWHLGSCRSYALSFARAVGFSKILMVDDDIIVHRYEKALKTLGLLAIFGIVGAKTAGMPDDSVMGHILRQGATCNSEFISGQFMAIDLKRVSFPFPDIYNEDWAFVLLHSLSLQVARYSSAYQLPYNPVANLIEKSMFQEPGEVFCVGVIEAVRWRELSLLLERSYWTSVCRWRIEYLESSSQQTAGSGTAKRLGTVICALKRVHLSGLANRLHNFAMRYFSGLEEWRERLA